MDYSILLWCNTCQPLDDQLDSQTSSPLTFSSNSGTWTQHLACGRTVCNRLSYWGLTLWFIVHYMASDKLDDLVFIAELMIVWTI